MRIRNFLFCLFFSGCAFFVSKIDSEIVNKKNYLRNLPDSPTYCSLNQESKFQLINSNQQSQVLFQEFLDKNPHYDFLDRFAFWTLIQMAIRPDQSSPSSRFQVLIQYKNQGQYFDFFSESLDHQYPLLYGLDWILNHYGKKNKLESYAAALDQHFPRKNKAEKELEAFLSSNKEKIKDHPVLGLYFIRGIEVLKENERMPSFSFLDVIKFYREKAKKQSIIINNSLNRFVSEDGQSGRCNYDFNLYSNSIFLIDNSIPVSNLFGMSLAQDAFMASTSQKIDNISPIHHFPLFYGDSRVRSAAVCMIENGANKIWAFSNQSRDPGQHLFHLIRYGLVRSKSTEEVDKLIRHSRHLFLSDPVRLIIESGRSRQDQIENLLKLNLPIYHGERLGNIWGFTSFGSTNRFIIDDRNVGSYSCK